VASRNLRRCLQHPLLRSVGVDGGGDVQPWSGPTPGAPPHLPGRRPSLPRRIHAHRRDEPKPPVTMRWRAKVSGPRSHRGIVSQTR
jgi:hypothetical protein